jgi:hypothetical protein
VYRSLDFTRVIETADRLARRIRERFPEANLGKVADELARIVRDSHDRAEALARPNLPLRAGTGVLLLSLALLLFLASSQLRLSWKVQAGSELIQVLGSLCEALIVIGGGIAFLVTLETRIKRGRALQMIHELRALAHIVDMHQLTKDPAELLTGGPRTESSPERTMTDFELQRYLDYSSEMLAVISKVGALYAQNMADPVVLAAVDEVEDLTNGLSRKIWQKISMLQQLGYEKAEAERTRRARADRTRALSFAAGTTGAKARHRQLA